MTDHPLSYYLRILLVSLVVLLLGLAPVPRTASATLAKAFQAISQGDELSASQYLARAATYYPWRYELNLQAARFAMAAGEAKAAIEYLERPGTVIRLTTNDLIMLGDAYNQSGDPYMAEAIWKHVTQMGDNSPAYERLAELYLNRKDYESAISYLKVLQTKNPSDTRLYFQLGSLYAATDPTKALPFLAQAVELDTTNASQAQELYDRIRTANLFDDPAYTYLISGRQLANAGEWELAVVAFKHATELQPDYADAWAFLGEARQQVTIHESGVAGEAGLGELERALKLDPDSILANMFMGLFWERHQEYSQAQTYLEHAIAINPSDPYLYSELANVLSKAGDLPSAQSRYTDAIQLAPKDPLFYCLLAEFALDQQIQIRELALPAARHALDLAPNDAHSLDVMAQVMLMLRDYNSAERFAQNALRSDAGYAPAYLHLGTAYTYLNQPNLARQWLGLAKSAGTGTWVASQAQRMLEYYFP